MYRFSLLFFAVLAWFFVSLAGHAFETRANAAFVYDVETDMVIFDKNASVAMPPASMSKLMTLNMVFEALEDGRITLETKFRVSRKAASMGGSKMFVREGSRVSVINLLRGVIVQSGNDACIVLAEGLAGTEEEFAARMTQRAKALGLENSRFENASGWPAPKQRMSMRDLVMLAKHLIEDFPQYYHIFREHSFTWDNITQENRNPLLGLEEYGADGLKTGYTEQAGYGFVGSAKQGKRRVIFAISGLSSKSERAAESERILAYAFRQFTIKRLFEAGQVIGKAGLWVGQKKDVPMAVKTDLNVLMPVIFDEEIKAELHYTGPIITPVQAGDHVGQLVVSVPSFEPVEVPVVAAETVLKGGLFTRFWRITTMLKSRLLKPKGQSSQ